MTTDPKPSESFDDPSTELARELQKKRIAALAKEGAALSTQIDAVKADIEVLRQAGLALLPELQRAADEAHRVFLRASARLEAQKVANDSALAPLRNRLEELLRAFHQPAAGTGHRVKGQWALAPDRGGHFANDD